MRPDCKNVSEYGSREIIQRPLSFRFQWAAIFLPCVRKLVSSKPSLLLWNVTLNAFRLTLRGGLLSHSSPFRIVLTSEEQEKLETRARKYTSSYRDVIRAKIRS